MATIEAIGRINELRAQTADIGESVIDLFHGLDEMEQDTLTMHFAAVRVLESTQGGGWPRFRVDGPNIDQINRLPDYIGQYVGEMMPKPFYDEDGRVQFGGGVRVRPEHTKFKYEWSHLNETTGQLSSFFRWDKELWDYDTWEATEKAKQAEAKKARMVKYLRRGAVVAAGIVELIGFGLVAKGIADVPPITERNEPTYEAELDAAHDTSNTGLLLAMAPMMGTAAVFSGAIIKEMTAKPQPKTEVELVIR